MGKIKNGFRSINKFVREYFLMGIILGAGIWYFSPEGSSPIAYRGGQIDQSLRSSTSYYKEEMADAIEAVAMDSVSSGVNMKEMARSYIQPPVAKAAFEPNDKDRKIVKNASLQLEVTETEEAKKIAEAEVTALDGYVTNQTSWEARPGILAYNMTIRIPSQNLENLIANLSKTGTKKGENYSINDITTQYRDTDNQVQNLETRRDRLRKLIEFETKNLNDVLQVDRELTTVQNQIDNLTRTQRRRDIDVDYSTLQFSLSPEAEIGDFSSGEWNFEKSWKQNVNDFIYDARNIVDKSIKLVIYAPIWLPVLLIFFVFRSLKRKSKKTKK